jgi:signal transduction histidine kinase
VNRTPRILLAVAAGAALVSLLVSAQTFLSMRGHGHDFWRIIAWQLGSWSAWVLFALPVLRLGASLPGSARTLRHVWRAVTLTGALIAAHIVLSAQLAVWLQPYMPVATYTFGAALTLQLAPLLVADTLVSLTLILAGHVLEAGERAQQLALAESRLQAELAEARLESLRLEIQPHFLFNTLNSIAALIRMRSNDKALEMVVGLSELMRGTLDRTGAHTVPLAVEVDFVKRYVDLQRVRFADRLDVNWAVDSDCESKAVPAFLLQPLVENALRHGMARRTGPCRIQIAAGVAAGGNLRIAVIDDGVGLPPGFDLGRDAGTGLSNIGRRLRQMYGERASMSVTSAPRGGTVVEIVLPATGADARARASA